MKIYVASSWRNEYQPTVVKQLLAAGYAVYDFRSPSPFDKGFAWSHIDSNWINWSTQEYLNALNHPKAKLGYAYDIDALNWCEVCVLVLPCGRSAHLEAGYAKGQGKKVYALLLENTEPELMYKMFDGFAIDIESIVKALSVL